MTLRPVLVSISLAALLLNFLPLTPDARAAELPQKARPETSAKLNDFNSKMKGTRIYLRYSPDDVVDKNTVLEFNAEGRKIAVLKPGDTTVVEMVDIWSTAVQAFLVRYDKKGTVQKSIREIGKMKLVEKDFKDIFISCGRSPLWRVYQTIMLPDSECKNTARATCTLSGLKGRSFPEYANLCLLPMKLSGSLDQQCGAVWNSPKRKTSPVFDKPVCVARSRKRGPKPWLMNYEIDVTHYFRYKKKKALESKKAYRRRGLSAHLKTRHVEPLVARIENEESKAWGKARTANTRKSLAAFLKRYPKGRFSFSADRRMVSQYYDVFMKNPSVAAGEKYLEELSAIKRRHPRKGYKYWDARKKTVEKKLKELPWQEALATQKCRSKDDNWVYFGDSCNNGWVQGEATLRHRKGYPSLLTGTFENGVITKGAKMTLARSYVIGGPDYFFGFDMSEKLVRTYEGEFALKPGKKPRFAAHGRGASWGITRNKKTGSEILSYDGQWKMGDMHGEGMCRFEWKVGGKLQNRMEPCEYNMRRRIDELHKLRKEKKTLAKQAGACSGALSSVKSNLRLAREGIPRRDPCTREYADIKKYSSDPFWLEQYDGSSNRPIGAAVRSARECRKKRDGDFWFWANSVPKALRSLRKNNCPELSDAKPYEDAYRELAGGIERRAKAMERYEDDMLGFERKLVRQGNAQNRSNNARWARELASSFGSNDFDRSLQRTMDNTIRSIKAAESRARAAAPKIKSSALSAPRAPSSTAQKLKSVESRLKKAEQAAAKELTDAKKHCANVHGKWVGGRCERKSTIRTRFPGRACSDPTGKKCKTGETLGKKQSPKAGSGKSSGKISNISCATPYAHSVPVGKSSLMRLKSGLFCEHFVGEKDCENTRTRRAGDYDLWGKDFCADRGSAYQTTQFAACNCGVNDAGQRQCRNDYRFTCN